MGQSKCMAIFSSCIYNGICNNGVHMGMDNSNRLDFCGMDFLLATANGLPIGRVRGDAEKRVQRGLPRHQKAVEPFDRQNQPNWHCCCHRVLFYINIGAVQIEINEKKFLHVNNHVEQWRDSLKKRMIAGKWNNPIS